MNLTDDEKKDKEPVVTEYAKQYNDYQAGTKGLSGKARTTSLSAYRKRLASLPRVVEKEPRAWAYAILTRIADGEIISQRIEQMARDAIDLKVTV